MRNRDLIVADVLRAREVFNKSGGTTSLSIYMEAFSVRLLPVTIFRISSAMFGKGFRRMAKLFTLLNVLLFRLEASPRCRIGGGLVMPHCDGTIIGAASIGDNCIIYHQVTLGARVVDGGYNEKLRPVIGNGVIIGCGAKVLGGVVVADSARIGANAVVVSDVSCGGRVFAANERN